MKKFKLNLERLGVEMEVLDIEYSRSLKGGYGGYGGYSGGGTGGEGGYDVDYEIYDTYSPTIYGTPGGGTPPPIWWGPTPNPPTLPGGYSGGYQPAPPLTNKEKAALAISVGFAMDEFYAAIDYSRINGMMSGNDLIKAVLDTPHGTYEGYKGAVKNLVDQSMAIRGIAIIDVAGKILGVTGAVESLATLTTDIMDGGGVNMVNVADAAVNVGSLFIKSNLVGVGVSLGWMIIKGQFE